MSEPALGLERVLARLEGAVAELAAQVAELSGRLDALEARPPASLSQARRAQFDETARSGLEAQLENSRSEFEHYVRLHRLLTGQDPDPAAVEGRWDQGLWLELEGEG